ncbi:MAG: hypothetical protein ABIW48_09910 [Burkholderiales bacterium]
MRSHLAYLAARLMAEDGIQDYGAAKRKAARQAGVPDTRELPDNLEVEAALKIYQSLYQAQEQPAILRDLRQVAFQIMQRFAAFNPYLVGSVLTGTAGEHSDINLHLFADSAKEFEIFLLNEKYPFELETRNFKLGDRTNAVPVYRLEQDGAAISAAVFERDAERVMQKYKADGRPVERAKLAEVKTLLDAMPEGRMDA